MNLQNKTDFQQEFLRDILKDAAHEAWDSAVRWNDARPSENKELEGLSRVLASFDLDDFASYCDKRGLFLEKELDSVACDGSAFIVDDQIASLALSYFSDKSVAPSVPKNDLSNGIYAKMCMHTPLSVSDEDQQLAFIDSVLMKDKRTLDALEKGGRVSSPEKEFEVTTVVATVKGFFTDAIKDAELPFTFDIQPRYPGEPITFVLENTNDNEKIPIMVAGEDMADLQRVFTKFEKTLDKHECHSPGLYKAEKNLVHAVRDYKIHGKKDAYDKLFKSYHEKYIGEYRDILKKQVNMLAHCGWDPQSLAEDFVAPFKDAYGLSSAKTTNLLKKAVRSCEPAKESDIPF